MSFILHPYKTILFHFLFRFLNIMLYILNIVSATKNMTIKELQDFICGNNYKRIRFSKQNSYYSMKHQEKKGLLSFATKLIKKILNPSNTEEYLFEEKTQNLVKRSKITPRQPKIKGNSNIVDIKSTIIEHPKTSHKLSKTIKLAKKLPQIGGADNPLYSETKK